MQAPVPLLQVITIPPGATSTQQRIVIDGIRGAIFEYAAGNPLGNLVSSWASKSGVDPYGNGYPQGFDAGLGSSFSGTDFVINSNGIYFYAGTPGAGNPPIFFVTQSGTDPYGNTLPITQGTATYLSGTQTAVTLSGGDLGFLAGAFAANFNLSNITGFLQLTGQKTFTVSSTLTAQSPGGTVMPPDLSLTDNTVLSNANNGTALVTKAWSIPANDANVGTVYEVETDFSGTFEAQAGGLTGDLNATALVMSSGGLFGGTWLAAGTAFTGTVKVRYRILTTGTAGTCDVFLSGSGGGQANRSTGNANIGNINCLLTGQAINTTVANTIGLYWDWAVPTAGQTVTVYGSTYTRKGT